MQSKSFSYVFKRIPYSFKISSCTCWFSLFCCKKNYMSEVYLKFYRHFTIPTPTVRYKFVEYENICAHEVLENNANYNKSVVPHPLKVASLINRNSNATKDIVVNNFYDNTIKNLEQKIKPNETSFLNMVLSVTRRVPSMELNDIKLILLCLCLWPIDIVHHNDYFKFLWRELDKECSRQLKNWTADQKLLIADYWFHLYLSRISTYNNNMILSLINRHHELTQEQFVQLMFFMMLQKSFPHASFNNLASKFENIIKLITIEELSLVCLSYFKNDVKVRNLNVLKIIIDRTVSGIDKLDSLTFIRIIKFLRKSFQDHAIQYYIPLLKSCIIYLKQWDIFAAVHTAIFCTKSLIFEPSLLDVITLKLKEHINTARIKDISKVIQCLSQFNYMSHLDFHSILFEEVMKPHRLNEISEFPREILNILLFYAYMEKYPFNIIEYVLSPNFVKICENTQDGEILRRLAVIDYCLEIECKAYKGPRLNPSLLRILETHKQLSIENAEKGIITYSIKKIINSLNSILNPSDCALHHILPHAFNPDIIIRLNSKQSASLQSIIMSNKQKFLKPPIDELWGCLILCGPFSFPYKSDRLCGLITMKERHLKELGYKVLLMPYKQLPLYEKQRQLYLKHKIKSLYANNSVESKQKLKIIT